MTILLNSSVSRYLPYTRSYRRKKAPLIFPISFDLCIFPRNCSYHFSVTRHKIIDKKEILDDMRCHVVKLPIFPNPTSASTNPKATNYHLSTLDMATPRIKKKITDVLWMNSLKFPWPLVSVLKFFRGLCAIFIFFSQITNSCLLSTIPLIGCLPLINL